MPFLAQIVLMRYIWCMEATARKKVQVKDLNVGDILTSGATVISKPVSLVGTAKGKVQIGIEYKNGTRKNQVWGKFTNVVVIL